MLPNLILDRRAIPELFQEEVTPDRLAATFAPLLGETRGAGGATGGVAEIDRRMQVVGETPSQRAARIVIETIKGGRSFTPAIFE